MTLMQIKCLDKIEYLVGSEDVLRNASSATALPTFSDKAVGFLSELSKELMAIKGIREHQDVMSYAYWIRKASLEQVKNDMSYSRTTEIDGLHNASKRIGRGVAFHIAPSNVPVNFAVSMTSSLLAGNISIIRVSSKRFEEVDIICGAINRILEKEEFTEMKQYICIIRYEHSDEITAYLSSICDIRIIWGGNRTIEQIRKHPIPPRAIEMCFADRHSVAIIRPSEYLVQVTKIIDDGNGDITSAKKEIDKEKVIDIAKKFYTDTYYSDQNACSSPRMVIWLNDFDNSDLLLQIARELFWAALGELVDKQYDMQPIQAVDKYSAFSELSMKRDDVERSILYKYDGTMPGAPITNIENDSNKLMVVDITSEYGMKPEDSIMNYKCGGGYFFQCTCESLYDIIGVLDKQCQTVAVLGIDKREKVDFVMNTGVRGVDRVVDIGDTMGLEFIWDGYNMIETMSRIVYIYE